MFKLSFSSSHSYLEMLIYTFIIGNMQCFKFKFLLPLTPQEKNPDLFSHLEFDIRKSSDHGTSIHNRVTARIANSSTQIL